MNSKSPLPKLPSIGELLKHPRVRGLVERVNQSTIATRAAEFFDEVRSGLAERAGQLEPPSLAHLAERFARRVLGEASEVGGPIINAGGALVGNDHAVPPLAEAAVHAMLRVGGEYHRNRIEYEAAVAALLCRVTGAEAACVTVNFDAALLATVTALAAGEDLVVDGAERSDSSWDWQMLATRSGAVLRDSSASDRAVTVRAPEASFIAASDAASTPAGTVIDAAPLAGLIDPVEFGFTTAPTIQSRLQHGADVVLCDGAGLLGGPSCGVVVGRQRLVETIVGRPLYSAVACDALTLTALQATLELYEDADRVRFAVPLWQLLSTPLENLQHRAERLAPLIRECAAVAVAEPTPIESPWATCGAASLTAPSVAIRIEPTTGAAEALAEQLRRRGVLATADSDAVLLDLRAVFPRWDQQLVAALTTIES